MKLIEQSSLVSRELIIFFFFESKRCQIIFVGTSLYTGGFAVTVTDGFAINPDVPGRIDSNYTGASGKLLSNRLSYPRNY